MIPPSELERPTMKICHDHNLATPLLMDKPYGIRVTLLPGDSFLSVIDADWERLHWFATEDERDQVLADMRAEHLYSRRGDQPTTAFQAIKED
jgi:hypothetical protein